MADNWDSIYKEVPLEISLPEPLPPISHLLVYYVTDAGETVADSVRIDAKPCLKNQVCLVIIMKTVNDPSISAQHLDQFQH